MGQAKADVPRWKRKKVQPPGNVIMVTGRNKRAVAKQIRDLPPLPGTDPRINPKHLGQEHVAFRFRYQLVPAVWGVIILAGLQLGLHGFPWYAAVAAVVTAVCGLIFTRHLGDFDRPCLQASALWAGIWCAALAWTGTRPWLFYAAAGWFALAGIWWNHYRWRPVKTPPQPDTSVEDKFAALAAKRKWAAWLGPSKPVDGGMVYQIQCRGSDTHIGEVVAQPKAIAATYSSTVAQVYAEEHPMGLQDQGELYMLRKATLEDITRWDGAGVSRETGMARIGRWPDGKTVYEQVISLPRDGTKNCMVAGADGSGKSALLDLGIANSAVTGWIAPIILDPQNGQALPAWREHVPYACGTVQCMAWLRALWEAMQDRSSYLASLVWVDPKTGKHRKGLPFFNPFITIIDPVTGKKRPLGLPVIEITIDEASILLAEPGAKVLLLNLIKLGRKVGVRVRLATQVPSLNELKAQEIRSLLIGGGAFCLRTGDKVSGQMMNITAAPWELPKKFLNGQRTLGLGYAATMESRPNTPFRADWLEDPWEVAETTKIAAPDDRFAAKMAEIIAADDATADKLMEAADSAASLQLLILDLLPKTKGQLIQDFSGQLSLTEVTTAVESLINSGKAVRRGDRIEVL